MIMQPQARSANPLVTNFADAIPAGGTVVDLGCGPGRNALFLAEQGFTVAAVDRSGEAIAALKALAEARRLQERITTAHARIEEYPFSGPRAAIVCTFVLHFLGPRALETLDRMQAATAPGGLNIVEAFTENGQWSAQAKQRGYFFKSGELRERYAGWDFLFYEEKLVKTMERDAQGRPLTQEATAVVAQKRGESSRALLS